MRKRISIIQSIRHEFASQGYDLSHLTDKEIEKRSAEGAKMVAQTGVTMQEACDRLTTAFKEAAFGR